MFPKIKILKLKFFLKPLEKIVLPEYKGSTFRGAFGIAFKKAVCVFHNLKDCNDCLVANNCIYLNVFETPIPASISNDTLKFLKLDKITYGPHPFIIEVDKETNRFYYPKDTIIFDMIILGKSIQYYPYFIHSVSELGKTGIGKERGKFEIGKILAFTDRTENENIFDKKNNKLLDFSNNFILNENLEDIDSTLTMEFLTPTRIINMGNLIKDIKFQHIVINLVRRIFSLLIFHYDFELKEEHIEYARSIIIESENIKTLKSNLEWYNWERWSGRQNKKISLNGFVGKISFEGNLKIFSELIHIGQYFHLGKNTVFGLGEYRIKN